MGTLTQSNKINSLFVRWSDDGEDIKGAFITRLKVIYEDDVIVSTKESPQEDVALASINEQAQVQEIIGKMQVDQAVKINAKEAELASVKSQLASKDQELAQVKATLESKESLSVSKK